MKFAGGSPAAGFFLLLAQKKETKEKGTLLRRPSDTLCSSPSRAAAQLARSASRLRAQTVLAEVSRLVCGTRRLRRGKEQQQQP